MNNFKNGKNLFGISSSSSVSGLYVDLTTAQSINGIKTFLSNLIANSNVNFNTTGNIGRIVFKPNETAGFGGNLLTVYTTDENDSRGWIFDADGNLYYLGTGFIPQKIFFSANGNINAVGAITCGSLDAITGTIQTTGAIFGGSITGSSSITGGSGSFTTINGNSLNTSGGPITGGAGSFTTGDFSANVNITGATNGLTISGGFSGLFCNKIESQSGGAIVSSAVFNLRSALAVTNITLDPLNTIRLKINGITGTNSYLFFNNSNNLGFFNTSTGTNTWTITNLGAITCNSITASARIQTTADIVVGAGIVVSAGDINAFGNIEMLSTALIRSGLAFHNSISPYSGSTITINANLTLNSGGGFIYCNNFQTYSSFTYANAIRLNQLSQNPSISAIELSSQYVCFAHPSSATTSSSKYLFISPAASNTTGDFYIGVNNVSQAVIATDIGQLRLVTDFIWEYRKPSFVSGAQYIRFINGGTNIGSVSMLTGSTVNYNISSDYRLKQDIKPLEKSLDRIMKLQPKNYRFIKDVEDGQDFTFDGFIAHEVQEIIPMAVSGVKDDPNMMQQMDYSKLTPLLTGAVQELNELVQKQQILIDTLIKRIEILENK